MIHNRTYSNMITMLKCRNGKIVRTDRINILRKQYDSFLEEDKKRKERNDYILQRLDKMRYTTSTAFQLRPKIFAEHNQPPFNRFEYRPENVKINDVIPVSHVHQQTIQVQPNLELDIPRQFDDISILREISKKYILIPKLRTFISDNYVVEGTPSSHDIKPVFSQPKANTVDNGDWRSKYDILKELKIKEAEENNNEPNKKEAMASNEPSYKNAPPEVNNVKDYEIKNNNLDEVFTLYKTELPEKDIPSNTFVVENELAAVDKLEINENPSKPETNTVQILKSPERNTYTPVEQIHNIECNAMENNVPVAEVAHFLSQQEQNSVYDQHAAQEYLAFNENEQSEEYQNYPNEYEQQNPETVPNQEIIPQISENDIYVNENEYSPIQTINPSELVQEIYSEPEVKHDQDTLETEYPIDVIDVAEFTPEDNVQLQDGININPEYVPNQESYDTSNVAEYVPKQEAYDTSNVAEYVPNQVTYEQNNVEDINDPQNIATTAKHADNSGIEAFDSEQKEMFYSEHQGAYDQQAGDAYDPEYVPNEQYPENSTYNYYGQLDQQEAYPVEINEHEETSQLYDPNYEQQYAPTQQQEYVEPQLYEEHQQQFEQTQQQIEQNQQQPDQYEQQYEQPALYEQMQQGYEQYAYEQQNTETNQDIEQVLDKEEGYVEEKKAPIAVEKKAPITAEKKAPVTAEKKAPVTVEKKAKKAVKPKT